MNSIGPFFLSGQAGLDAAFRVCIGAVLRHRTLTNARREALQHLGVVQIRRAGGSDV